MTGDFDALDPTTVLRAVETAFNVEIEPTLEPFNSYVNRVYGLTAVTGERFVVKFYRPGRWDVAAIEEEHDLLDAAAVADIPVVPPIVGPDGYSLYSCRPAGRSVHFSLFPRRSGRTFDCDAATAMVRIGSLVGRLHRAIRPVPLRRRLRYSVDGSMRRFLTELDTADVVHPELADDFFALGNQLCELIDERFRIVQPPLVPIHGDLHRGNILDRAEEGLLLIDFDDAMVGPAIQDVWMLTDDRVEQCAAQWEAIIDGYEQFLPFDRRQLTLVEPLRAMRMVYYLAWQCRQRFDRAFVAENPDWGSRAFWIRELADFNEQAHHIAAD